MAKKFGKVLFLTAALSGAAAAVYYYLRKKDEEKFISEDEDYDDFGKDLDDESENGKKYVSLTPDAEGSKEEAPKEESPEKSAGESFVPLDQVAPPQNDKDNGKNDPEVEEFFDEDDAEE